MVEIGLLGKLLPSSIEGIADILPPYMVLLCSSPMHCSQDISIASLSQEAHLVKFKAFVLNLVKKLLFCFVYLAMPTPITSLLCTDVTEVDKCKMCVFL